MYIYCIYRYCIIINPFSPRPTKTSPFIILFCLMPNNFTHQGKACWWERVNWAYLPISLP